MESAAVLRSFHHSGGTTSHVRSVIEMPGVIPTNSVAFSKPTKLPLKGSSIDARVMSSPNKHGRLILSCAKTSETTVTAKSNGAVLADSHQKVPTERSPLPTATFPKGFEALITEVCDDTEVAELKLKVGDFELHLKRNIEAPVVPVPVVSAPPPPPPSASKPSISSTAAAPAASPGKSSTEKISPFTNVAAEKSAKLAALEASGASGYVLVSCPTVGSFQRARALKGKKQPPACKEGDVIKEGQIIGFLDQFGTELPVRSDAAGEVLRILFNDGEAVGYVFEFLESTKVNSALEQYKIVHSSNRDIVVVPGKPTLLPLAVLHCANIYVIISAKTEHGSVLFRLSRSCIVLEICLRTKLDVHIDLTYANPL
ncbi:hypothetical protein K7X08_020325 [Anisodus acutangulus]|uniref:Lipoyl-binding domain-containing protein n=1 Tax=Anisodus acutangulus TaxID=402998 RepID=A0A9Q1M9Z5_9SOLA|nr:hypothetical protein K7X08_020325 [Anisodus acutangulus]